MNQYDVVVLALDGAVSLSPLKHPHSPFLLPVGGKSLLFHTIRKLLNEDVQLPIHIAVESSKKKVIDEHMKIQLHENFPHVDMSNIYHVHQVDFEDPDEIRAILSLKNHLQRDFLIIKPTVILNELCLQKVYQEFVFQDAFVMIISRLTSNDPIRPLVFPGTNGASGENTKISGFPIIGIENPNLAMHWGSHGTSHRIIYCGDSMSESPSYHPAFLLSFPETFTTSSIEKLPCVFFKNSALDEMQRVRDSHSRSSLYQTIAIIVENQTKNLIRNRLAPDVKNQSYQECNVSTKWWLATGCKSKCEPDVESGPFFFKKDFLTSRDPIRCFCYLVAGSEATLCVRNYETYIRCVGALRERQLLSKSQPALLKNKSLSHIEESVVGASFEMNGIGTIKQSTIGANVIIGDKCRIIDSIVMDNVFIGEGCKIINSILCNDTSVKQATTLTSCIVNYCCTVETGVYKGEIINVD